MSLAIVADMDGSDCSSLLHESEVGNLFGVRNLIKKGENVEAKDKNGDTPLHNASDRGYNDIVQTLIGAGAKVNIQNEFHSSPLHYASGRGYNDVVTSLCLADADVHAKTWDERTPLHNAATNGHMDVVTTLLQYGADMNAKNKYGKSVLHLVAEAGKLEVMHLLIQSGADRYIKDPDGKTPFDTACDDVKKYFFALKQKDFPREIIALGPHAVVQFVKAREKGSYTSNIIRCMIVGHFGVGKTTLARKLMNTVGKNDKSTNGIDVHIGKCYYDAQTKEWITQEKHTELIVGVQNISQIHIWDFGGQLIFYTTHQSYLSRRGLYLLVFDLSMGLQGEVQDEDLDPISRNRKKVIDYLEFWIGSIRLYCQSKNDKFPKIVLIGTHKDEVQNSMDLQNITDEISEKFQSVIKSGQLFVSCDLFLDATNLSEEKLSFLKDLIVHAGQSYPEFGEIIPESWMKIHEELQKIKLKGERIIPLASLIKILSDRKIQVEIDELQVCLLFFHAIGYCVYFKEDTLKEQVILDAGWIIDAMKSIITHETFIDKLWKPQQWIYMKRFGIVQKRHIIDIWNRSSKALYKNSDHLFHLMEKLDLITKPKVYDRKGQDFEADYYCVPALLKSSVPPGIQTGFDDDAAIIVTFQYDEVLPLAVYNRLVASCLNLWEVYENHIYNGLVIFRSGRFHLIKIQKEFLKIVLSIIRVPHTKESLINVNLCRAIIQFVDQNMRGVLSTYINNADEKSSCFTIYYNDVAKERDLDPDIEKTQNLQMCPTDCPGPEDNFRETTVDDKLLIRLAQKCRAEDLMPLSANMVGNVQFYEDKREEFRELTTKDFAFFIFHEWKCILMRKHKEVTVERLVEILDDADVDIHIICQALQSKEEDDSFLSPIVRQMEVYNEFIDAVADQMSATYLQIGIELGFNLGEIKQMRVSHQCSAPKIVREMLRIWLKRNGPGDEKLIGSLASALLHAQDNIAVLMDIEGKAVIQHLSKKKLSRQSSQECLIS